MSVLSMAIGSHSPLPMVVYTVPFTPSHLANRKGESGSPLPTANASEFYPDHRPGKRLCLWCRLPLRLRFSAPFLRVVVMHFFHRFCGVRMVLKDEIFARTE